MLCPEVCWIEKGRKFYFLPVLSVGDAWSGNRKERSDISATPPPPTSATLLFHTQNKEFVSSDIWFWLNSNSISIQRIHRPHCYSRSRRNKERFSDIGINFPVYGTTVTPYEPAVNPTKTTTTSGTPYVPDDQPSQGEYYPRHGIWTKKSLKCWNCIN